MDIYLHTCDIVCLPQILVLSDPNLALTVVKLSFEERQPSFGCSEPEIDRTQETISGLSHSVSGLAHSVGYSCFSTKPLVLKEISHLL